MTYHAPRIAAEGDASDRRIIRVDVTPDQAGIAAALRRAFAAGRVQESEDEFGDLLKRLN